MAGSAISPLWRADHLRPVITSNIGGAVGGAVVDHDRSYARWYPSQYPTECRGLIDARQDDVDLRRNRTDHALTLRSAVTCSAEVNRFRLAYALEQECVAV